MNQVVVILGSNIEKEWNLPRAIRLLAEQTRVVAVSSVYETAPVGSPGAPLFFNAAVRVETPLDAAALKRTVLADIERKLQRVRTEDKNAPRTIDLDIVLFNDEVFDYDGRSVPDPDLQRFLHVAAPVAELLPAGRHPKTGELLTMVVQRLIREAAQQGPLSIWKRLDVALPVVATPKAAKKKATTAVSAAAAA